jgi:hypothetical protein
MHEHHEQISRIAAYEQAVKREKAMKKDLIIQHYKRYYGFEPPEGTGIPLNRMMAIS